jgi:hypothetical protein
VTPLDLNVMVKGLGGFNMEPPRTMPLGTLFELVREEDTNEWRMIQDFGDDHELHTDWAVMSVVYVGKTKFTDETIAAKGTYLRDAVWCTDILASDFVQRYPKYNGYRTNCQNFTLYLLRDICTDVEDCPKTIRTAVKHIMRTLDHSSWPGNENRMPDGPSVTIMWRSRFNSKLPIKRYLI